jgi:hypothetical protein
MGVAATIGVRAFINTDPVRDKTRLTITLNVFQEVTLISSLITNILGTGVISLKAWYAWGLRFGTTVTPLSLSLVVIGGIVADLQRVVIVNKRTKAERVLALIIESGVFYIFSGVRVIVSLLIKNICEFFFDLVDLGRIIIHTSTLVPHYTWEYILSSHCSPGRKCCIGI